MRSLPQFVVNRLQGNLPSTEPHPDPDLLTAFAEQSLVDRERRVVVEHLARCGDCRDVVAVVSSAIESEAETNITGPLIGKVPWLAWPALRWGALAAGVLIVASVGIVQYGYRRQSTMVASDLPSNQTIGNAQLGPPDAAPASQPEMPKKRILDAHEASASPKKLEMPLTAIDRGSERAPRNQRAGVPSAETSPSAFAGNQGLASANAPPPAGGTSEMVVVEAQSQVQVVNTQTAAVAQNQLAQNRADLPMQGRVFNNLDVVKAKDPVPQSGMAQAAAPAIPNWSIGSGGSLQRSYDGGKTWEDVQPTVNLADAGGGIAPRTRSAPERQAQSDKKADAAPIPRFLAVATNGPEVWAGGSGGSLYHTADAGDHWARVSPSVQGAVLTGDVTDIQFPDQQHGRISTSTLELWLTSDAGQTWLKQPLRRE